MKRLYYISTLFFLALFSCEPKRDKPAHEQPKVPEAMAETESSSLFSKRTPDDPVNHIYINLIAKSEELKSVEDRINDLPDEKQDSTIDLTEYLDRNDRYYESARRHISSMTDSVMRSKILAIMEFSKTRFDASVTSQRRILNSIDSSIQQIRTQRELVKVLLTLPVIEEYQRENRGSDKPAKDFEKELEKLQNKINVIIKKNGG